MICLQIPKVHKNLFRYENIKFDNYLKKKLTLPNQMRQTENMQLYFAIIRHMKLVCENDGFRKAEHATLKTFIVRNRKIYKTKTPGNKII